MKKSLFLISTTMLVAAAATPAWAQDNAQGAGGVSQTGGVANGPVVRIARGNNVTLVPVGAR